MTTLMILMPTGGQIDTPAVHSLLGLTQALPRRGRPGGRQGAQGQDQRNQELGK